MIEVKSVTAQRIKKQIPQIRTDFVQLIYKTTSNKKACGREKICNTTHKQCICCFLPHAWKQRECTTLWYTYSHSELSTSRQGDWVMHTYNLSESLEILLRHMQYVMKCWTLQVLLASEKNEDTQHLQGLSFTCSTKSAVSNRILFWSLYLKLCDEKPIVPPVETF